VRSAALAVMAAPGAPPGRPRRVDETLKAGSKEREANSGPAGPDRATVRRFEALVLPHTDAAYNLALRLTREPEAAEDIVHDAFLRALGGFAGYHGGDPRAWILTIVRNRAFDWLRERKRRATVSMTSSVVHESGDELDFDPPDPDQETPEEALIRKGEAAGLHALIGALPPVLREALVLREMEELSYRQIAEITAVPIGSVMSRLSRARAQLGAAWRRLHEPEKAR
jgi:RNA polymerase sigma factor (sigma-70 family)